MTFSPRARAREMAEYLLAGFLHQFNSERREAIESALLAFAKEVLTQEPDAAMVQAGRNAPGLDSHNGKRSWLAMSAHRAKSLEPEATE